MEKSENIHQSSTTLQLVQQGLTVGFPIIIGYFPIAITYGVLAKQAGMTVLELTAMSILVYAGASQFMAVNMIAVGAGALELIIATFVLNFRHFVMSLSFVNRLRHFPLKWKIPLSLGLTDETFAVSTVNQDMAKKDKGIIIYITLFVLAYLSWVSGSLVGGLLGEVIPTKFSQSMGIALYAMFIGLLIPSVKKEAKVGLIALIAMFINVISSQFMSSGWAIVCGTIIGGASGIFLLQEDQA